VENSAKALEQTKALADTLAADKDGRFANSKFLQFISKMSRGEIILEGNEVCLSHYHCSVQSTGDIHQRLNCTGSLLEAVRGGWPPEP
jgi:peroxin-5